MKRQASPRDEPDDLVDKIAPYVLKALRHKRFFETLDDQMCPTDPAQTGLTCGGTYGISITILAKSGFDADDTADITSVLASKGGCCDCEILYNVAPKSRLRSLYWKGRGTGPTAVNSDSHHPGT